MSNVVDYVRPRSGAHRYLLTTGRFLLVRHPRCLEKLKAEIKSTVGSRTDLSRTDLKAMKYLENVLNESRCACLTCTRR